MNPYFIIYVKIDQVIIIPLIKAINHIESNLIIYRTWTSLITELYLEKRGVKRGFSIPLGILGKANGLERALILINLDWFSKGCWPWTRKNKVGLMRKWSLSQFLQGKINWLNCKIVLNKNLLLLGRSLKVTSIWIISIGWEIMGLREPEVGTKDGRPTSTPRY